MTVGVMVGVACVVLAAGAVQTTVGFGFSLFAVPLLSFVVDAKVAVVIAGTVGLLASSINAARERRHTDRGVATRMIAGAAVGSPVGLALLTVIPERGLRVALAVAVAVFVVVNVRGLRLSASGPRLDLAAGFVSGTLNTMLSTNGPPLVAVLHARHLAAPVFRATVSVVFAVSSVLAIALYAASGRYDATSLRGIAVAVPALALGQVAGGYWRDRLDPAGFRRSVTVLLALTAVASAIGAFVG
jgi:uncharacterized protein